MSKADGVSWLIRLANFFTIPLLRHGVKLGNMALLTVRGRKSGVPHTTPLAVVERNNQRYLVGTTGESQWVRNLRAAGTAVLTRGRHAESITIVELAPSEAAIILKDNLSKAPSFVRQYFDVTPASPLADFEREALRHPVFLVQSLATQ